MLNNKITNGINNFYIFQKKKNQFNNNKFTFAVFRSNGLIEPIWQKTKWRRICVGDIVKVLADEQFPADLLLLSSRFIINII